MAYDRTKEIDYWLEQDGKTVLINGHKHKIRAATWKAIYPYEHQALSVMADPINKNAKWYREIKADLGDDWATDVLSSFNLECGVRAQLDGLV